MKTAEIKRRYLAHFEANGHTVVPSAPLPAISDPNLLFVNAGMVQFVPYFLGQQTPPYPRAVSVQKCIRTPDIDEVGKTSRHGTFFQMNGNFSFGDYFKDGAIPLAWDLVTKPVAEGGFGLDPERIWPTVYLDDDEAFEIWRSVGVPAERIVRRGKADNFWSMGIPGPCGPCSELFYDRGPEYGREGGPEVDEDRYMEFWNLVFMQYERGPGTQQGGLPDPRRPAGEEHRHRHGPGADGLDPAGRRQPVRDRRGPADPGPGGRADRQAVRRALRARGERVAPGRRAAAGDRRPRAHRADADRRRRHPAQRGPRLRAAPDHAPGDPVDAAARLAGARRCPSCCRWPGTAWRRRTRSWPTEFDRISRVRVRARRRRSCPRCGPARRSWTPRSRETKTARQARRCPATKAFQLHDTYGFPIDLTLEIAGRAGPGGRRGRASAG